MSLSVSLCLDGGQSEHRTKIAPLLASRGIPVTFMIDPTRLLDHPTGWSNCVKDGCEIGISPLHLLTTTGALPEWSFPMLQSDLKMADDLCAEVLDAKPTTFALPGWSTECRDGDYLHLLTERYQIIRTDRRGINEEPYNLRSLNSIPILPETRSEIEGMQGRKSGWLILRIEHWETELGGVGLDVFESLLDGFKDATFATLSQIGNVARS